MRFVVLDFETFFSIDYTLSKLSTEAYIRDPRFQAHGAAIKWSPKQPAKWYDERFLRQVLKDEDWNDVFLIHHHAQFDGFILAHHYDVHPARYGCTLSMARLLLGNHLSVSLDAVRQHFGLPAKRTPYNLFKGKHWHELDQPTQALIAEGACDEVESIWILFQKLMRGEGCDPFPREELGLVDMTIRMFVDPILEADTDMLGKLWLAEENGKHAKMAALGVTEAELQSADRFVALLEAEGVEVGQKNGKHSAIPAFAKTDEFMRDLLEHDNERVRLLAAARLGIKSTLLQSRAESLGWMAARGKLSVYLRYAGAHTFRWSGGDRTNFQNFNRGSDIRKAILAPDGYLLAVIDLSQIERRICAWLAGEEDYLDVFRRGEDPYIGTASRFYKRPITKEDKTERQVGKILELQCQYGSGGKKIAATLRNAGIVITEQEGLEARDAFRAEHPGNVRFWADANRIITRLSTGETYQWGPMLVRDGKIVLPNGAPLDYTTLENHEDVEHGDRYWRVKRRYGWTKLYGGKLVENIVQALARVVLSQAMLRINQQGYRILMTSHDEIVVLLRDDGYANQHLDRLKDEMRQVPAWMPGIPLDAEATIGKRYSK